MRIDRLSDPPRGGPLRTAAPLLGALMLWNAGGVPAPADEPLELTFVPRSASMVFAARPAAIYKRTESKVAVSLLSPKMSWGSGAPLESLEQIVFFHLPRRYGADHGGFVLRTATAADAEAIVQDFAPSAATEQYQGQTLHLSNANGRFCFRPDPRIVVGAWNESYLRRIALDGPDAGASTPWAEHWRRVADAEAAMLWNLDYFRPALDEPNGSRALGLLSYLLGEEGPQPAWWQTANTAAVSVRLGPRVQVQALAACADPQQAQQVEQSLGAAFEAVQARIQKFAGQLGAGLDVRSRAYLAAADDAAKMVRDLRITRNDRLVTLRTTTEVATIDHLDAIRVAAARGRQVQDQTSRRLKRIALAFHQYHDVYRQFPATANRRKPTDPHPHSWRVALLPFLQQGNLYDNYRLDEPWDSDHNKQFAARMPDVYRHPQRPDDTSNTSYAVFAGPTTLFTGERMRMADVRDGTSLTLLVVESRNSIPWTKPEDLPFDSDSPFPELGFESKSFFAAFVDGSVKSVDKEASPDILRALVTPQGREIIEAVPVVRR